MNRIVLVDENSQLLKRINNAGSPGWQHELVWAPGPQEALSELRKRPADVLLMNLHPGLEGVRPFLREVDSLYPEILRIALVTPGRNQEVLHLAPMLHHLLANGCPVEVLLQTIDRSSGLKRLLRSPEVQGLVLAVKHLPSLSEIYLQLQQLLADPDVDFGQMARIIEQDPAMTAELLHLANSAFFGRSRRVYQVEDAIVFLGRDTIRTLTLSYSIFRQFDGSDSPIRPCLENLQRHSLLTARIAMLLAPRKFRDEAFVAAILHDIGILLVADRLPHQFEDLMATARKRAEPLHFAEYEFQGTSHAELGGYLLDLWGLPPAIVEAVSHHHMPTRVQTMEFDVLAAVHVADALAEEAGVPALADTVHPQPEALAGYLACFGMEKRLPAWQRIAEREAARLLAPSH